MKAPSLGGRLGAALGISAGREGSPTDGHRRWRDGGQCLMGDAVVEGEKTIAVTECQSIDSDSFVAEFVYYREIAAMFIDDTEMNDEACHKPRRCRV